MTTSWIYLHGCPAGVTVIPITYQEGQNMKLKLNETQQYWFQDVNEVKQTHFGLFRSEYFQHVLNC